MVVFDPDSYLKSVSKQSDSDIDFALSSFAISSVLHEGISVDRYVHNLRQMERDVAVCHKELLSSGAKDDVRTRLAALKYVLSDVYDYCLSSKEDEVLDAADMIRVIDQAKGCAEAVSILCMKAARSQGWGIEGLGFPDYFVCRMEKAGELLIFDPAQKCRILVARDLRAIVKESLGSKAELSASYLQPLPVRGIIVRLYNKLKLRLIEMGDYEKALKIVEAMHLLDPNEYKFLLDSGVLKARLHKTQAAITDLEEYIKKAPHKRDRQEATLFLSELKNSLL